VDRQVGVYKGRAGRGRGEKRKEEEGRLEEEGKAQAVK